MVEQRSPKPRAEGSSPSAPATDHGSVFYVLNLQRKRVGISVSSARSFHMWTFNSVGRVADS